MTYNRRVQIVVAGHCLGCEAAMDLIAALTAVLPLVHVEWLDLETPGAVRPRGVVAVPSYLVNGRVAFVGNPTLPQLRAAIVSAEEEEHHGA